MVLLILQLWQLPPMQELQGRSLDYRHDIGSYDIENSAEHCFPLFMEKVTEMNSKKMYAWVLTGLLVDMSSIMLGVKHSKLQLRYGTPTLNTSNDERFGC